MKKTTMLFIFLGVVKVTQAQAIYDPASSPYIETVSCTPAFSDAFACASNPAAIANLQGFVAACYLERKYLIKGLNLGALSLHYGRKGSGAGLSATYFGNSGYHELHAALNYGKNIGAVNLGASFVYHRYAIAGFAGQSLFCIGVHSVWKLSDKFYASLQLNNPPLLRRQVASMSEKAEYHFGIFYETFEALCFSFEFQKIDGVPMYVRTALQFQSGEKLRVKAGISTSGPQPFVGLGWLLNGFQVQFSVSYHPALGMSPGILFSCEKNQIQSLQ